VGVPTTNGIRTTRSLVGDDDPPEDDSMTTVSPDQIHPTGLDPIEPLLHDDLDVPTTGVAAPAAPRSRVTRLWRGDADDPRWVRPSLVGLLAATAVLYLWGLSASGWANAFYSAAVQAGSQSWKAFLFGSSDAANFITVDKPPAALWPMEIAARIFGVNSWSILVPQALMGVASVGLLYLAVRRWAGPTAGLIAGTVLAVTPVATLMFRFNNPDALLVLLLTAAAYTTVRAVEKASTRWLVATGVLVGFAFLTKSLQAFLPVPAFALAYLLAAPTSLRRRVLDLLAAGAGVLVAAGWWVALVELWPASSRPYIGGSQTNSVWELIWGYNGLGRITGNEVGSVTGGGNAAGGATSMWGETGWSRLFSADYGGQVAWLIPAALALGIATLWVTRRAPRTDRVRAATILWLGWLLVTALVISYAQGIIHSYYTVALAPAIGALVGIGGVALWRLRDNAAARITLAFVVAGTSVWAAVLLSRSSEWLPWLRYAVLVLGIGSALALLVVERLSRRVALAVAGTALISALLAPTAYSVQTAATAHTGSLPSAGPAVTGARGPGGPGGGRPGAGGFAPPAGFTPGQGTQNGTGALPGGAAGGGTATMPTPPSFGGGTTGGPGGTAGGPGGTGGPGGLLDASTPSATLTAMLSADSGSYSWIAAAVGAQTAAGYQLATGLPVMSLGGFNGSDPWPTLAAFQSYVAAHQVHYFIGGGGFGGAATSGSSATSEIASWVSAHYTAQTVDGVTVYDLTAPTTSTTSTTA
jgi:4-amino-4-deoxy-L-arabinose transferase-like glycosyltransferase